MTEKSALVVPTSCPHAHVAPVQSSSKHKSQPFWLGGAASMGAACCSHPLDLLKVRLQCATTPAVGPPGGPAIAKESLAKLVGNIIRNDGILSLYNGLSASLLRQATYSTVRFGIYEELKRNRIESLRTEYYQKLHSTPSASSNSSSLLSSSSLPLSSSKLHPPTDLPMMESIAFSVLSGSLGGVAGNPADLVNVRMQNDKKLPVDQRRNYRNVADGLLRIGKNEGILALWKGVGPNIARAALMTTGQLTSYDWFKSRLVHELGFNEKNIGTHLTASCLAGVVATVITQPVDVVKTRIMNSASAANVAAPSPCAPVAPAPAAASSSSAALKKGTMSVVQDMLRQEGPQAFFKGFVPALTRLGPHTIATFVFLEQLKKFVD